MIPGVVAGGVALLACSGRKAMLYQSISPTFSTCSWALARSRYHRLGSKIREAVPLQMHLLPQILRYASLAECSYGKFWQQSPRGVPWVQWCPSQRHYSSGKQ